VRAVEPAQVQLEVQEGRYVATDGVRVTVQSGEGTGTLDLARAELLRRLEPGDVQPGDRVAVRDEGGQVTLLVIR
jgi:hypothetical protein